MRDLRRGGSMRTPKWRVFTWWVKLMLVACVVLVLLANITFRSVYFRGRGEKTKEDNVAIHINHNPGVVMANAKENNATIHINHNPGVVKANAKENNATIHINHKPSVITTTAITRPQHRITINFQGRLGNQLFMFSSLYGIAKANNLEPFVRRNVEMLNYFKHTVSTYSGAFKHDAFSYGENHGCAFEEKVMNLGSSKDTVLNGYFQSWKYFVSVEKELRRQLQFKDNILRKAHDQFLKLIKQIPTFDPVYVGVHVRRGDMVFNKKFVDYGYISAGEDYINKALSYMRYKFGNTIFVVASDDMEWCKQHITGEDITFIEKGNRPEADMATLTFCNHSIMTTGSFGWWTSFFTGGDTVYYGGYPRPNTTLDKLFDKAAYYPPHWVKIS